MSTRDKTREKLLNSMRKTKKVISDQPDTKQAHADTYAHKATPAAAKTTIATQTTDKAPSTKVSSTKPKEINQLPETRTEHTGDPYQSRGRVWPD